MLPKLYSTETGEAIEASPEQYAALVSSGKAAFRKGEQIPILDANGTPGAIASEDFARAAMEGYRIELPEEMAAREAKERYSGETIRAGAEGLARGLSLGLSDPLLVGLGVDKEGLEGRKEANPVTSTVTEFTGAAAPILLSGGTGAAAKGGAVVAKGGARAALELAPSALAARAGTAVTEKVAASMGVEGAKSLAGKIAQSAIPMAAGSAVEGAIYTAGAQLSEAALGDPDQVAENAIANIGLGAMLGAGVGGLVGAVMSPFAGKTTKAFVSELDEGAEVGAKEAMQHALDSNVIPQEQKKTILEGLTKLKRNAPEIEAAAKELGVPVLESQVSASTAVQSADGILLHPANPSPPAIARRQLLEKGIEKVEGTVNESLGSSLGLSQVEAGNILKKSLTDKFESAAKPISALYEELKKSTEFIPVSDKAKQVIAANLRKETQQFTVGIEKKIGDAILDNLPALKTVDDIKRFTTELYKEFPFNKSDVARYAEKLTNLEENSVIRAAEQFAKETGDIAAKKPILELIEQRAVANKAYSALREKMSEIGEVIGKKRIAGPADFLNFIDNLTPEKLSSKLFTKGNSEFLQSFSKNFPEEFQVVANLEKSKIRDAALRDGVLDVKKVLKSIDKLEPEIQGTLFSKEELKRLNAARVWIESLPPNVNPSGSGIVKAALEFAESPKGAILGTIRDYGLEKFVKGAVGRGADMRTVQTLAKLEESAQKTGSAILNGVKAFLQRSGGAAAYGASKAFVPERQEKPEDQRKFYDKQSKAVTAAATDPERLLDTTAKNFEGLAEYAPKVAQSLSAKSAQAAMFLYEKMPKNPFDADRIFANKKWFPSDHEIAKWKRYVDTVENPMSAIKSLRKGAMTIEQADALKNVYPEIYGQLTRTIMEELPRLKDELPYQKRLQLGILFQIPTDPSLNPKFIQSMQAQHAQSVQASAQQQGAIPSGKRTENLSFAQKAMTGTERIINRA